MRYIAHEREILNEDLRSLILGAAAGILSIASSTFAHGQDVLRNKNYVKQVVIDYQKQQFRFDIGEIFPSGRYLLSDEKKAKIGQNLGVFLAFLKELSQKGGRVEEIDVHIVASESKVPNYDGERGSETFGQRLKPGQLSEKRAATLQQLMFDVFSKFGGVDINRVVRYDVRTLIGGPDWKQGDDPDSIEYKKNQFVYMVIDIKYTVDDRRVINPAFSKEKEIVYDKNNHALAYVYYRTRESKDYEGEAANNKEALYSDMYVQFLDMYGRPTGENYLVGQDTAVNYDLYSNVWSDKQIQAARNLGKKVK